MARIESASAINQIHGKTNSKDSGYFFMRSGKLFYRTREESYQKKQSPKQKLNSAAFAYANAQMAKNYGTPEGKIRLAAEYEAARHIGSNGKKYTTPWSWKFNSLQYEFRQANSMDELAVITKQKTYQTLLPQIEALVAGETDIVAKMANVAAALHEAFGFLWTGFYLVRNEGANELVLGPFQGPVACTRIPYGKGVCGTAWQSAETVIVPNVHAFTGHIACSSESNSEIVVPVIRNNQVVAVLDIDSKDFNTFDETDKRYLEQIANIL